MQLMSLKAHFFYLLSCLFLLTSCKEENIATPKPRAFPRVIYPTRGFQKLDVNYCKFTFEYPTYTKIQQDTSFFGEKPVHPCWFDVYYPQFDARIYCSYYPIDKKNTASKLIKDAFELAGKHNIKANYIDELPIKKPNGVSGFVFDIQGAVASPFQFYLTDSTKHFLRGSLYFNTQSRPDSLAPITNFIKTDVMQLVNTFEWKK
jgi:gliding motility-associated lipoprotein GldD